MKNLDEARKWVAGLPGWDDFVERTRAKKMNRNKPDGKVHRHPVEGYTLACETLLDGEPAVVTYHTIKGQNGGGRSAWWVTEATVALCEGDVTERPVHANKHGYKTVRHGYSRRQALGVYPLNEEGFVIRGNVAVRRLAKEFI